MSKRKNTEGNARTDWLDKSSDTPLIGQYVERLGSFLDAIAEWGWPEAPARRLIFPRDAHKLPHPLPRYLPPDAERALLRALEGRALEAAASAGA